MATFGVGAALQHERLSQGLSLSEIARQTRISQRFLEAIELENFDRIPGLVFTRNFVRQYASYLKMDPQPLLALLPRVNLDTTPLPDPSHYGHPRRTPAWMPAFSTLIWVALAAAAMFATYIYTERPHQKAIETRARSAVAVTAATAPDANGLAAPVDKPAPLQAAAEPNRESDNRAVQVILKAKEASWVQVIADGKTAFTGILNPNDSREIAADALVKVTAGNAGGIEISLNGKSLDPLGASGQVKTVRLTAEGPQLVSKIPSTESPLIGN